jgi:hypothetical protein
VIKHRTLGWARYGTDTEVKGNAYIVNVGKKHFRLIGVGEMKMLKLDLKEID